MTSSANYGFNQSPQFSVNHLSEYLATSNATQRTKVICAAKFPKKVEVAAYSQIRKPLRDALTSADFGRGDLHFLIDRLDDKARREVGYARDEALRCAAAVRAFQGTFNPRSFSRVDIRASSRALSLSIEGVRVKVGVDADLVASDGDRNFCGAIYLMYAFSADRGDLRDRCATISGMILWALEGGQMEPLPRLCMAADIAEQSIVRASASHTRFRSRITDSCREVAALWDGVPPPPDYDGPDWT